MSIGFVDGCPDGPSANYQKPRQRSVSHRKTRRQQSKRSAAGESPNALPPAKDRNGPARREATEPTDFMGTVQTVLSRLSGPHFRCFQDLNKFSVFKITTETKHFVFRTIQIISLWTFQRIRNIIFKFKIQCKLFYLVVLEIEGAMFMQCYACALENRKAETPKV